MQFYKMVREYYNGTHSNQEVRYGSAFAC